MPLTTDGTRGIAARDRLSRIYANGDDIFDDLPIVLEEIADHFARRRDTFMTIDDESLWLDFGGQNVEISNAALAYASYFDAFTSLSRRQQYEDGNYRHVSMKIMEVTYPVLVSQTMIPIQLDEILLAEWKHIIGTARSAS